MPSSRPSRPRPAAFLQQVLAVVALMLGILPTRVLAVWPGRVQMGPYDRIGFVRLRKVGSTAVHLHLERVLHTCVSRCLAPAQKCKTCLYSSSGCTACTNITDKIRYKDAHCYPCMHYAPEYIQATYHPRDYGYRPPKDPERTMMMAPGPPRDKSEWRRQNTVVQKHRLLTDLTVEQQLRLKRKTSGRRPNGIDGAGGAGDAGGGGERLPYLYWVTVLRNPVDRVFSEFFFLRPACGLRNTRDLVGLGKWLDSYPKSMMNAVCANDIYSFGTSPESPAVNQQTRQISNVGIGYDGYARPELTPANLRKGFAWLNNIEVVLIQEDLYPTGMAMLDFVFGHGVQGLSNTTAGLLHSAQVGAPVHELHGAGAGDVDGSKPGSTKSLRTTFKENKTLCAAIRMANSYDMLLHGEAARIYNFNKAAMLHLV